MMTDDERDPLISVITATRNVESTIGQLYASLARQTYRRFEWIVMDGLSSDSTIDLLRRYGSESPWLRFVSAADCGIYDAINKGLIAAKSPYYIVVGADDVFTDDALSSYAKAIAIGDPDVVLSRVKRNGSVVGGFYPSRGWIGHSKAFPVPHSVGMLFRKALHEKFGMYSSRFPLLADGYFLKRILGSDAVIVDVNFIAGTFAHTGISSVSKLQTLVETWQIQMLTERYRFVQTLMFIGKIMIRYPAVARELAKVAP
jgi:glycosyltransferase involved in cell wall biosynthesis